MNRIKELRKELKLTQKELASKIGVSDASVNKYEKNLMKPKIDKLMIMSDIFSVSVDYITGESDNRNETTINDLKDLNGNPRFYEDEDFNIFDATFEIIGLFSEKMKNSQNMTFYYLIKLVDQKKDKVIYTNISATFYIETLKIKSYEKKAKQTMLVSFYPSTREDSINKIEPILKSNKISDYDNKKFNLDKFREFLFFKEHIDSENKNATIISSSIFKFIDFSKDTLLQQRPDLFNNHMELGFEVIYMNKAKIII